MKLGTRKVANNFTESQNKAPGRSGHSNPLYVT